MTESECWLYNIIMILLLILGFIGSYYLNIRKRK